MIVHPHALMVGEHADCADAGAGIVKAPAIASYREQHPLKTKRSAVCHLKSPS